ncbi:MAG: rhomboid family intramembrane serine protease [Myxococcaceae bacterium]|nr:rhomboid family intramembrane serine protease [Myxococcaceae bacterium]MCA3016927.1 rhomboid family intramembrane serine protease [Myxococcaceae bacterium]
METRRPFATFTLVGMNLAAFAAMVARGVSPTNPDVDALLRFGANRGSDVVFDGEWWRALTCMFLHIGVLHLAVNLYSLWRVGAFVERLVGPAFFAAVYVLAGLGGSFASILWNPTHVSAGASGAIFGLFGFIVGFVIRARNVLPPDAVRSLWDGIILTIAINLFLALSVPYLDNAAHLGGLAVGLFAGVMATDSALERQGRGASFASQLIVVATVAGLGGLAKVKTENDPTARLAVTFDEARAALERRDLGRVEALATEVIGKSKDPVAYLLRAIARSEAGDVDGGFADVSAAVLESAGRDDRGLVLAEALSLRGSHHQAAERHAQADGDFSRAHALRPEPVLLGLRGFSRLRLGDVDGGVSDAAQVLSLDAGNGAMLNNLAWGALHAGVDLTFTLALANAAVDASDTAASRGTRCWVRAARGETAFALPDCEAAVARAGEPLDLGMLAFLRGQDEEAIARWEQARRPADVRDVAPWLERARARLDAGTPVREPGRVAADGASEALDGG